MYNKTKSDTNANMTLIKQTFKLYNCNIYKIQKYSEVDTLINFQSGAKTFNKMLRRPPVALFNLKLDLSDLYKVGFANFKLRNWFYLVTVKLVTVTDTR